MQLFIFSLCMFSTGNKLFIGLYEAALFFLYITHSYNYVCFIVIFNSFIIVCFYYKS